MHRIRNWNILVSVREECYQKARTLLGEFGVVGDTDYYNVLAMCVDDIMVTLELLRTRTESNPEILQWIGHIAPVTKIFSFQSPAEFETKAKEIISQWLPQLADKAFHIRMHRRGFKERLSAVNEERLLGKFTQQELTHLGAPGRITFDAPHAIIAVETLGQQAGMALWSREELERYPFMHVD